MAGSVNGLYKDKVAGSVNWEDIRKALAGSVNGVYTYKVAGCVNGVDIR